MKAVLKFNLPDESEEFKVAVHSKEFYLALYCLDEYLRSKIKYGHAYASIEDAIEDIREQLHELMRERDISFDMMS